MRIRSTIGNLLARNQHTVLPVKTVEYKHANTCQLVLKRYAIVEASFFAPRNSGGKIKSNPEYIRKTGIFGNTLQ